ncbi:MAG: hypothetical protein DRJ67_10540, partial [Thermoprotei archaeon]
DWEDSYREIPWWTRGGLVYGQDTLDVGKFMMMSRHLGLVYVTSGDAPQPWGELPPYLEDMFSLLTAEADGLVAFPRGVYMRGGVLFFDDFVGDNLQNIWTTQGDVQPDPGGPETDVKLAPNSGQHSALLFAKPQFGAPVNSVVEFRMKINSTADLMADCGFYANQYRISVYFKPSESPNWQLYLVAQDNWKFIDTGVPADTNWHVFRIETSPDDVRLYMDGRLVARETDSSYIFNGPLGLLFYLEAYADGKEMRVDYVWASRRR